MELFSAEKYRGKKICVALSGGVDSVSLLHAFRAQAEHFGIALSAIHVEHGIRGEHSLRDMAFCEKLCRDWNIPLQVVQEDVPARARENGLSLEEAARNVRYAAFRSLLLRRAADCVATAHHADDVAETVLFRLARGTGISGMRAITEYGGIVRPLLARTRAEISAYAEAHALPHVEDLSNADENFTRNYIRGTVIPAFEKIHPSAAKHLVEFASLAAEEDAFLQRLAEERIIHFIDEERVPADLPDALFFRACLSCLRRCAPESGYTRANLEEIAKLRTAQSGKKIALPQCGGDLLRYALREGKEIVFFTEPAKEPQPAEIAFSPEPKRYPAPSPFTVEELPEGAAARFDGEKKKALLVDLDAFPAGCVVRVRREGDVFTPYHAPRKALKKFLTDRKIPARLSKKIPVIAKGSEVYVVVGVEIADAVKATEKTVRHGIVR